ncbi:MAG: chemotaxis protein CheD [Betaproteobacteria bacterium]|nr:chemotaxis protein CheD [Betaproteobacteria bacterium]
MTQVHPNTRAEVVLMPGDLYFGRGEGHVTTLLGSCVAVVLWHPLQRIGAMCHYLLPSGTVRAGQKPGLYADAAIATLARMAVTAATRPPEYVVRMFGGGEMFPRLAGGEGVDIGARNARAGRELLVRHGFAPGPEDIGGETCRRVRLDLATGVVTVHGERRTADTGLPAPGARAGRG